jgi:hypothetical protein
MTDDQKTRFLDELILQMPTYVESVKVSLDEQTRELIRLRADIKNLRRQNMRRDCRLAQLDGRLTRIEIEFLKPNNKTARRRKRGSKGSKL